MVALCHHPKKQACLSGEPGGNPQHAPHALTRVQGSNTMMPAGTSRRTLCGQSDPQSGTTDTSNTPPLGAHAAIWRPTRPSAAPLTCAGRPAPSTRSAARCPATAQTPPRPPAALLQGGGVTGWGVSGTAAAAPPFAWREGRFLGQRERSASADEHTRWCAVAGRCAGDGPPTLPSAPPPPRKNPPEQPSAHPPDHQMPSEPSPGSP